MLAARIPSSSGRNQDGPQNWRLIFCPFLGAPRHLLCLAKPGQNKFPSYTHKKREANFCTILSSNCCIPLFAIYLRTLLRHFLSVFFRSILSSFLFPAISSLPLSIASFPISRILRFPPFSPAFIFKTGRGGKTIKERGGGGSFCDERRSGIRQFSFQKILFLDICSTVNTVSRKLMFSNNFSV